MHSVDEVGEGFAALEADHPGRTLLGIGVSNPIFIDQTHPGQYKKPLQITRRLPRRASTRSPPPCPATDRVLAALGPKMLELARDRAGGAHPYLVTPEHTEVAREALGDGPLLAPEQHVVLETDPRGPRRRP